MKRLHLPRVLYQAWALCLALGAVYGAQQAQAADGDILYNFSQPGSTGGWARAWGDVFREQPPWVEYSDDLQAGGFGGSLEVHTAFKGGSWEEINIGVWLSGKAWEKSDLTDINTISFDLLLPVEMAAGDAAIRLSTALDKEWAQIGPSFAPFPFTPLPRVTIGGKSFFKITKSDVIAPEVNRTGSGMLILRLAGYHINYNGPIYFDNIALCMGRDEILPKKPRRYDTVAGVVPLQLKTPSAGSSGHAPGGAAYAIDGGEAVPMDCAGGDALCTGQWDSNQVADGFHTITYFYTPPQNGTGAGQRKLEVFVHNAPLALEILSPQEFRPIVAHLPLKVRVTGATPDRVTASIAGSPEFPLWRNVDGDYEIMLDQSALSDGAHTLHIRAALGDKIVEKTLDLIAALHDPGHDRFVATRGGDFVLAGSSADSQSLSSPVTFLGFNSYDLPFKKQNFLNAGQKALIYDEFGRPLPLLLPAGTTIRYEDMVDRLFMEARKRGMRVVRTWAFNSDLTQDEYTFYNKDWSYNETQFARFDYLLDSAARNGLRVIVVLQNNWSPYGGLPSIAKRFGLGSTIEFYENPDAQKMYRDYITHFVGRMNTISGVLYRDDPTIFSWELMNEPRMGMAEDTTLDKSLYDKDGTRLAAWMRDTAAFIKGMDPRHLISTGSEGHGWNGFGGTSEGYGTDPFVVMDQPGVDFFTLHFYPNADGTVLQLDAAKRFLCDFVAKGHSHGKPVLLEEWSLNMEKPLWIDGETIPPGSPRYSAARYRFMEEILTTFHSCGGNASLFWMLQMNQQDAEYGANVYTPADLVERDQSLWPILRRASGN